MNLYHQAILHCICRESCHIVIGFSNACTQALNYQGTLSIVATSSTNSIYHGLLILYYTSHSLSISPLLALARSLVHTRLIASCKEKMLVIVLKLVGNLSPDSLLLCYDSFLLGSIKDIVFQPSVVPVSIENDVHIILDAPCYDTSHTIKPLGINLIRGLVSNIRIPSTRNADSIKASSLQALDIFLINLIARPSSLTSRALHGVTDVDTCIHQGSQFLGTMSHLSCRNLNWLYILGDCYILTTGACYDTNASRARFLTWVGS